MERSKRKLQTQNIGKTERVISAIGGGVLLAAALKRRSAGSIALGLIGGDLLRRSLSGHCHMYQALGIRTAPKGQGADTTSVPYESGMRVDRATTIDRPRAEIYRFWRDLTNLPRFMKNVRSVTPGEGNQSHWVVSAPAGRTVEWDAVLYNDIENQMLAWRTLPGSEVDHAGSVWFKDAPGGRGTEVKVELNYNPPAGIIGAALATLWGKNPGQQIQRDLHRLKQILEAGEVLTTAGQPTGARSRTHERRRHQREMDREVHDASEESFPASDAPAYSR